MKKFPFTRQHDAMDCGPSCLRMITRNHEKSYNLEHHLKKRMNNTVEKYNQQVDIYNS
ncbi:MAG: hypothetical protein JSS64_01735 [Bacteroidetes bacterium]|nr:hypothetical protein [Bacteroidota bacterium]